MEDILTFLHSLPYPYSDYVAFVLIVAVAILAAFAFGRFMRFMEHRVAKRSKSNIDDIMLEAVKGPIQAGMVLVALYVGVGYLSELSAYSEQVSVAFMILFPFYGAYFVSRVIGGIIDWYSTDIAQKTKSKVDDQFLPIIKKTSYGVIFGIMILVMLNQLGIRVETVIAAMGIGGLAVALALQPTLSNFFSGVHMVLDRPLKIGDYVELDSGDKGTVMDIGWRSTKIQTYTNNIVVLPNSKIADSKIINYNTPDPAIGFVVECSVSYGSDLDKVEKVAIRTGKDVLKRCNGLEGFEPVVRFYEFGDSGIKFKVIMRTASLSDSYLAKHEFIKAIKKAFKKEGIEIPFPQVDVHQKRK